MLCETLSQTTRMNVFEALVVVLDTGSATVAGQQSAMPLIWAAAIVEIQAFVVF